MLPLLPFAAGIAAGALAIKLWRNENTRAGLDKAQEKLRAATAGAQQKLRQATVSSLAAIEHSSAAMRERLGESPASAAVPAVAEEAPAKPARKPAARKAAKPKTGAAA